MIGPPPRAFGELCREPWAFPPRRDAVCGTGIAVMWCSRMLAASFDRLVTAEAGRAAGIEAGMSHEAFSARVALPTYESSLPTWSA